ncbi:MAG: BolA family transcriptional regulator [Alphaproteobacteria bacterium]|jgi:BolA protein|nr:BolA family transcriptional regulator [Alphaproteobacteria bacterium]|tara:strand:- start:129 stop:383 length:255 start_codon:yes stop_codon:yes gene_type:complete
MNESTIYKKLNNFFEPEHLQVINDSEKHRGHAGSPNTGNSHFSIVIKSKRLCSINKVASQRLIYNVLKDEMKNSIHALSIKILT